MMAPPAEMVSRGSGFGSRGGLRAAAGTTPGTTPGTTMVRARSASEVIAERELIAKLSTWPWGAGTITGLGSALLVPIVVWAITRLLEGYL